MRFWSLNTARSTFAQGMVFRSYIGSCTVLMTCILLLVPLSSNRPGVCQHVRRIRPDRLLQLIYGSHVEVASFLMAVLRSLRTVLCAGSSGSEFWS
jgi:hypothetical protein